jgi:hypothetical protein
MLDRPSGNEYEGDVINEIRGDTLNEVHSQPIHPRCV